MGTALAGIETISDHSRELMAASCGLIIVRSSTVVERWHLLLIPGLCIHLVNGENILNLCHIVTCTKRNAKEKNTQETIRSIFILQD